MSTDDTPRTDETKPAATFRTGEPIVYDPATGKHLPPVSGRFPPGVSGNPKGGGRPAGATIRDWYNILAGGELTIDDLRAIIRDPKTPWAKVAAVKQALAAAETPDLATFELIRTGEISIEEAKAKGLPTDQIRKAKLKVRTTRNKAGQIVTETESEIELHERAADAIDRLHDRTEGRPTQVIDLDANIAQEVTTIRARRIPDQTRYRDSGAAAAAEQPKDAPDADAGNP